MVHVDRADGEGQPESPDDFFHRVCQRTDIWAILRRLASHGWQRPVWEDDEDGDGGGDGAAVLAE